MLKPGAKRFYKTVEVKPEDAAFSLLLDGKPIKTPAGQRFLAPTRALADAIAEEWRSQGERIAPETMPLTKSLNTAIDRVAPHRDTIVDDLARYTESDLLCYRASDPEELARLQSEAWDPWLDWADRQFGARLEVAIGTTYVEQPPVALGRLHRAIAGYDNHHLVALHAATTITGSAVLGLALASRALTADEAFAVAQLDEEYQAERWGRDPEAEAVRARRLDELRAARRFLDVLD